MKNWKTSLSGLAAAIGMGGFASQVETPAGRWSLILAALGILLKGLAAADASTAPKAEKPAS